MPRSTISRATFVRPSIFRGSEQFWQNRNVGRAPPSTDIYATDYSNAYKSSSLIPLVKKLKSQLPSAYNKIK